MFGASPLFTQEVLDVLRTGSQVYSNVTLQSKNATHIFIKHSTGYATIRVKNLDLETQQQFGYSVQSAASKRNALVEQIKSDPHVQEMQEKLTEEFGNRIQHFDRNLIWPFVGGLVLIHLFFSYCCMLICKKTANEPGLAVWLPVLQIFPMLRAAGMSGWWFLLLLLPGTNLLTMIMWSVKICQTRGKSGWLGIFLLLPVTNILVFLYLAFSDGGREEEAPILAGQFRYER
jgi:hypothetical protein